jgi:hypothetical protein
MLLHLFCNYTRIIMSCRTQVEPLRVRLVLLTPRYREKWCTRRQVIYSHISCRELGTVSPEMLLAQPVVVRAGLCYPFYLELLGQLDHLCYH